MKNRRIEVRAARVIKGTLEESRLEIGISADVYNDEKSLDDSYQILIKEVSEQLKENNLIEIFG